MHATESATVGQSPWELRGDSSEVMPPTKRNLLDDVSIAQGGAQVLGGTSKRVDEEGLFSSAAISTLPPLAEESFAFDGGRRC